MSRRRTQIFRVTRSLRSLFWIASDCRWTPLAALTREVPGPLSISCENGEGATRVAEAAREQGETLAEIERAAAALGEVSGRLNTYIARFSAMT